MVSTPARPTQGRRATASRDGHLGVFLGGGCQYFGGDGLFFGGGGLLFGEGRPNPRRVRGLFFGGDGRIHGGVCVFLILEQRYWVATVCTEEGSVSHSGAA